MALSGSLWLTRWLSLSVALSLSGSLPGTLCSILSGSLAGSLSLRPNTYSTAVLHPSQTYFLLSLRPAGSLDFLTSQGLIVSIISLVLRVSPVSPVLPFFPTMVISFTVVSGLSKLEKFKAGYQHMSEDLQKTAMARVFATMPTMATMRVACPPRYRLI